MTKSNANSCSHPSEVPVSALWNTLNNRRNAPFFLIAGPCVIESEMLVMKVGETLARLSQDLGIQLIFKSSFDKANRMSHESFRGVSVNEGLAILEKVRNTFSLPLLTDVHEDTPLDEVASVVDVLQTPAFLCRQTNFIQNVARSAAKYGRIVNFKKGQFLAPSDMKHVIKKAKAVGNQAFMVTERGVSFGYNNLVADMRSLDIMANETQCPVIFDATHSVQLPGGQGGASGGQRQYVPVLARAAVAAGIDGVFIETHPDPDKALSDGPTMWPLHQMEHLLRSLQAIDCAVKEKVYFSEEA